jgi:hypothetical protein
MEFHATISNWAYKFMLHTNHARCGTWIYYMLSSFMQQKFMMPPTHNTRVNSFHLYGLYKLILSKKVVEKHYDPYKSNKKRAHPLITMELGGIPRNSIVNFVNMGREIINRHLCISSRIFCPTVSMSLKCTKCVKYK